MRTVRVFISSPQDVFAEREQAERTARALNGEFPQVEFELLRWERNFYSAHTDWQAQIEEAKTFDIVIAIFWKRLGSKLPDGFPRRLPNGQPYPSGTAYEVLTAIEARQAAERPDIFVFRKSVPPTFELSEAAEGPAQYAGLEDFFNSDIRSYQWFRTADDFARQIEKLLRDWVEKHVIADQTLVWPTETRGSPFRGLAPFDAKHADVFFGRARKTTRALEILKFTAEERVPFLLIIGPSGSGKSSMMRAGIVPRLIAPGAVPDIDLWRVGVMHPTGAATPFDALAQALLITGSVEDDSGGFGAALPEYFREHYSDTEAVARLLRSDDAPDAVVAALDEAARAETARLGFDRPLRAALLLLVDQLEEVFASTISVEERSAFARLLLALARTGRIWILATLRADLYDKLILDRPFIALKDAGADYVLAPPGEAELAEIVQKSAEAAGLVYETDPATGERLDERLMRDAAGGDTLPLLQFTLDRLFEQRAVIDGQTRLTVAAYNEMSGLGGAIDQTAEQAVRDLGPAELAALPPLLRSLAVAVRDEGAAAGTGGALTSRVVPIDEVIHSEAARRLVDALVDARMLLTLKQSEGDSGSLRIAHERVLTSWSRAKQIIDADREFFRIRDDVEDQHAKWLTSGRRHDALITARLNLLEAERIVANYRAELPSEISAFVNASSRRARRNQHIRAAISVVFALTAIAATVAFGFARTFQKQAEGNYTTALSTIDTFTADLLGSLRNAQGISNDTIDQILNFANQTLGRLEEGRLHDPYLERTRADTLFQFAKTYQFAANSPEAWKAANEGLALRTALAGRQTGDLNLQRDLARSLELVGDLERERKEYPQAKEHFEQTLAVRRHLVDLAPDDIDKGIELSQILTRLGDLDMDEAFADKQKIAKHPGDDDVKRLQNEIADLYQDAGQRYRQSFEITVSKISLIAKSPALQREWSWDFNKLGTIKQAINPGDALPDFQNELCIRRHIARQSSDKLTQRDLAWTLDRVAGAGLVRNDIKGAQRAYYESLGIRRSLVDQDITNRLFISDLTQSHNNLALFERDQEHDLPLAFAYAKGAASNREKLAKLAQDAKTNGQSEQSNRLARDLCAALGRDDATCAADTSWQATLSAEEKKAVEIFYLYQEMQDDPCWDKLLSSAQMRASAVH